MTAWNDDDFRARLREVLTGAPETPLVLLGNFEVEDRWARGEVGLPRLGAASSSSAVVNRMDEFALLLATRRDVVVVKAAPDADYLAYLEALGLGGARVLSPTAQDPGQSVSQDVLADPNLLGELSRLAEDGYRIAPHGISDLEEEIAGRTGVWLAGPPAETCKYVNSKVYSRQLGTAYGLRQPDGRECTDLDELAAAVGWARGVLRAGRRVIVKDAYGVSGKGLLVVEDPKRLDQLQRLIANQAGKAGHDRVALVVEEWVDKRMDLNYQVTVGRDGSARLDFVKEAITEQGVHKGHRFPVALSNDHLGELAEAAEVLAKRLAADGYTGIAGMDAMVDTRDELYPVVEINARNNMSTYQTVVQEAHVAAGTVALARYYRLRRRRPLPFAALARQLGDTLFTAGSRNGFMVNAFATVNAAVTEAGSDQASDGRLYGLLVAGSPAELDALDNGVAERLRALDEEDSA